MRQEEAVQDGVSVCTVSQELVCLWYGDSSGTQEGECPPPEASTRRLVRESRQRGLSVYSELRNSDSAI